MRLGNLHFLMLLSITAIFILLVVSAIVVIVDLIIFTTYFVQLEASELIRYSLLQE